jgi:hypothetical protein
VWGSYRLRHCLTNQAVGVDKMNARLMFNKGNKFTPNSRLIHVILTTQSRSSAKIWNEKHAS